jgi:hypothetical protein
LKVKGLEAGHDLAVKTFDRQNYDEDIKALEAYRKQLDVIQDHRDKIAAMAEEKKRHDEYMMEIRKIGLQQKAAQAQSIADAYDDDAINALAWGALRNGGRVTGTFGGGPGGQAVRARVLNRLGEIARENNIPLSTLPGIQAEMNGAQAEVNTAARQLAYWKANIGTFHDHVKQFMELAEKANMGQTPVVNRAALKARGQYAGDADVANYEAMANEIAAEYAKLSVGTAQGDANSRDEARRKIDPALNLQQLRAVMDSLVRAGENRKKNWENSVKSGVDKVTTFGGRVHTPLPPGTPETAPPDLVWDTSAGKLVPRGR